MQNLGFRKLPAASIISLSIIVFGVGIFGASLVHRQEFMEDYNTASVCHTQDCKNPVGDPICASNCLSAFESSLQTLPTNIFKLMVTIFIFSLLTVVALYFAKGVSFQYCKSFVRKRREKSILSFFAQLGNWLALFEKREPATIFVLV